MSVIRQLVAAASALALLATVSTAGTSFRIEIGSTAALGMDKKFKDSPKKLVVAVRAVVCDDLATVRITGTAEGLVNGRRQSLPITLMAIDPAEAVYAIAQQWPQEGAWVLHLKGSCSKPKADASTLVAVTRGTFLREQSQVLRDPATRKQIEDAVAAAARTRS
jgi:hypothetical protein